MKIMHSFMNKNIQVYSSHYNDLNTLVYFLSVFIYLFMQANKHWKKHKKGNYIIDYHNITLLCVKVSKSLKISDNFNFFSMTSQGYLTLYNVVSKYNNI